MTASSLLSTDEVPSREHVAQHLQDPANATRSITDIALASGFCKLSHFSRVFREHTGGSPSEFSQQARRGA